RVIPMVMKGKDLIVEAKTGSGKTHAFLLPIFDRLDEKKPVVQAVICAPTRELATQITNFAKTLATYSPEAIDIRLYTGGGDRNEEIRRLRQNQPQIVIGTPGRLLDLIRQENLLKAYTANVFVIDEADMTLDEGFLTDVDGIASVFSKEVQMLVFSATIPEKLQPFLRKYLDNPEFMKIHPLREHNLAISHFLIKTREQQKENLFAEIITAINPYLAIVFANTKENCQVVYDWLSENKYNAVMITGDVPYRKRKQLIERIRKLDFQYVVATDILSRGIDIEGISHIINYDLPEDPIFYIHRTGRTGRMNNDGIAISLYEFSDYQYLDRLESLGIKCTYKTIKDRNFVDVKERDERTKRQKPLAPIDRKTMAMLKPSKKVKPRYKAKRKEALSKKSGKRPARKG
ncbi:MAG: DEAD/DEAH box helicase, partial [Bacilli bacterium]|nr:DEAD/DEAH box helicase [Bacilli bacterium]